jgi:hypothetical protein
MIVDHTWWPPHAGARTAAVARDDRPCAYLNCGQPIGEHAEAREATHVAWASYQKCPVCHAELGKPCRRMSGRTITGPVSVDAARAHSSRKQRSNGAR